jgi:hypothetical protein
MSKTRPMGTKWVDLNGPLLVLYLAVNGWVYVRGSMDVVPHGSIHFQATNRALIFDSFDDSGRSCVADPGKYCDPWILQPPQQLLPEGSESRNPNAKQAAPGGVYSPAK